jgi:hypothetical protein
MPRKTIDEAAFDLQMTAERSPPGEGVDRSGRSTRRDIERQVSQRDARSSAVGP